MRSFVSPGQRPIFSYLAGTGVLPNIAADGQQWRFTPQGYYYWGPFGIFGEYVVSSQEVRQIGGGPSKGAKASLANRAWQVGTSWFVTGDKNSWKPVSIDRPVTFASNGGWGALELVARVQGLHIDDDAFPVFADPGKSPNSAFGWGIGVNWHLNRNLKLSLDYENIHFTGGEQNPITADNEQMIFARVQVSF
jgi:phosphate-selective porin OprO/OprP